MKPSARLLERLVPIMEQLGYSFRKSNNRFLRKFPKGKYEFSLMFDGRSGLVSVDAGFFVHFDTLIKRFKSILGYDLSWTAGATLLNAGADPWKVWLFEERFAQMTPHERSEYESDVIHPVSRIDAALNFLCDAHTSYALPLFDRLQTYNDLFDFYFEYLDAGCVGRCRPSQMNTVYLSLILTAGLGGDPERIVSFAREIQSAYAQTNFASNVQAILEFIRTNDITGLLE